MRIFNFTFNYTEDSWFWVLFALFFKDSLSDWWLGPEKSSCHIFLHLFLYFCFLSHSMIIITFSFGPQVTSINVMLTYYRTFKKFISNPVKLTWRVEEKRPFLSVWLTGVFWTPTSIYFFCFCLFLECGCWEMIISWHSSINITLSLWFGQDVSSKHKLIFKRSCLLNCLLNLTSEHQQHLMGKCVT